MPTPLGTLYNKNGRWTSDGRVEQALAYFLPQGMELVVLTNSPVGVAGQVLPRHGDQALPGERQAVVTRAAAPGSLRRADGHRRAAPYSRRVRA